MKIFWKKCILGVDIFKNNSYILSHLNVEGMENGTSKKVSNSNLSNLPKSFIKNKKLKNNFFVLDIWKICIMITSCFYDTLNKNVICFLT